MGLCIQMSPIPKQFFVTFTLKVCTSIASQLTDLKKNLAQWHKDDLFIQKYLWTFVNCGINCEKIHF